MSKMLWLFRVKDGSGYQFALPFSRIDEYVVKPQIDKPLLNLRKSSVAPFESVGQHLKKKRLALGLTQEQVADKFELTVETIQSWENTDFIPLVNQMAKVIRFLGYNPLEINTETLAGKIKAYRYSHGLSHEKLAEILNVHRTTVVHWEEGKHKPKHMVFKKLMKLLKAED